MLVRSQKKKTITNDSHSTYTAKEYKGKLKTLYFDTHKLQNKVPTNVYKGTIKLYRGLNPPTMRKKGKYYYYDSNGKTYYHSDNPNDYKKIKTKRN